MGAGLFDKTITMLGGALDLRAARQKLLASNIANIETPGYKAVDIKFEDELKRSESSVATGEGLISTNQAHFSTVSNGTAEPRVIVRETDAGTYDQNSVGVEGEMVKLSENALMYQVASRMLRSKFATLMTAIKEGGR